MLENVNLPTQKQNMEPENGGFRKGIYIYDILSKDSFLKV